MAEEAKPTEEELLQEACVARLAEDSFFRELPQLKLLSRKDGDVASLVDGLLASIGAAIVVRTPIPSRAEVRHDAPAYRSFAFQAVVICTPLIASTQGLPSPARIARELERALHGFRPEGIFPTAQPRKWRVSLDGENPREDASEDETTVRYVCRFVFSQE